MSGARRSLAVKGLSLFAGVLATMVIAPSGASANGVDEVDGVQPALVHATKNNECRLNVRALPDMEGTALTTLTCANYTTCVHAKSGEKPCGPYVKGGKYSCVGPDNTQVTDNRWAEVAWRSPEPAYVAVACAEFVSAG